MPLQASKLSNFKTFSISKQFSVSGKKNVPLFGVMTKTSVSSDKNLPLLLDPSDFYIFLRFLYRSCRLIARAEQSKEIAWQMSTYAIELKSFGLSERKNTYKEYNDGIFLPLSVSSICCEEFVLNFNRSLCILIC